MWFHIIQNCPIYTILLLGKYTRTKDAPTVNYYLKLIAKAATETSKNPNFKRRLYKNVSSEQPQQLDHHLSTQLKKINNLM
jgi:hypothetical protein